MTSRFQEPNTRLVRKFCTYTLDEGYYFRKACGFDRFLSIYDADQDYIPKIEFDLAHDENGAVEIARNSIRVYGADDRPIQSPALQEIARQYLQDDAAHWERACDYLNEHGEEIEPDLERVAA